MARPAPSLACSGLPRPPSRGPRPAPDTVPGSGVDWPIGDELPWLENLIRRAGANASELRDRDIRLVDSMTLRVDRYGFRTYISAAQRKWLDDIARRLDEAGVPAPDRDPGPRDPDDPGTHPVDEALIEAREEAE